MTESGGTVNSAQSVDFRWEPGQFEKTVVVRGGGDLATGVVQKLWRAGFHVAVLEMARPTTIRRSVALSNAVFEGVAEVEDLRGRLVQNPSECSTVWQAGEVPVLVDPECTSLPLLAPKFLVDAILAKRNLGTYKGLAPITVALGPGFNAPRDVDAVIETMRGHDLGRLILDGSALPNTGVPGILGGEGALRVVHSPAEGVVSHCRAIGERVRPGEIIAVVGGVEVPSPLGGTLRGLIAEGLVISRGLKMADVDPRPESEVDWRTISDKARCLGGAVLEACLYLGRAKAAKR